jgi:uncharacterized protein (TIGR03435 family)
MRTLFTLLLLAAISHAQTAPPRPQYEVASVKPNASNPPFVFLNGPPNIAAFTATNATLQSLIVYAWQVKSFQIEGGPSWIDAEHFDISAKPPEGAFTREQYRLMLQALLEDRFKMAVHHTTKEVPVYALTPAKGGLKIKPASEPCAPPGPYTARPEPAASDNPGVPRCGNMSMGLTSLPGRSVAMKFFTDGLANALGRPVIDKTGFTGTLDVHLEFSSESPAPAADLPDNNKPTIFTALQEQLGLKLESQKGPADLLVIDHAEKPSEN